MSPRPAAAFAALALWAAGCAHSFGPAEPRPDYVGALSLKAAGPAPYQPGELDGHPVVVTFFATWCLPCLGQLPLFAQLQREHRGRGLKVVAVGMDREGARVLGPFAEQWALPYPVLVADEALAKGATPFGRVEVVPSTVILSREGAVVAAWPGLADAREVRDAVEQALQP